MSIRFDHPELLWLLLLAGPIVWLGVRSLATLEPARRWTAIGLRVGVLTLLVLMLAGMQAVRRHTDLTLVAVIDQSESVRRFADPPRLDEPDDGDGESTQASRSSERWVRDWLARAARDRRSDDRFGLVTYDRRPTVRALPGPAVALDPGTADEPLDGTDTADALRAAMAIFSADSAGRLLLVSDGNDTSGDLLAAAREAAGAGLAVDVLPVPYDVRREVMVDAVFAPVEAREGQTVPLRIVLRATHPAQGTLQVLHDGDPIDLNGDAPDTGSPVRADQWTLESNDEAPETSPPDDAPDNQAATPEPVREPADREDDGRRYVLVRQVDVPLRYAGANRFEAVFEPSGEGDRMVANNRAEAFTLVEGPGRVLFVDNVGGASGMILPRALQSRNIELDVVNAAGIPTRMNQMQRYDAVVLQNVPAELVSGAKQRMLARYVHDLGGGLVMVGGPDSFGAGGWTNSPIDQILPVSCQIPSQTILPSGALVIVLDRSGSMASTVAGTTRTQQELANEAAVLALSTLYPQDLVGVVAFDYQAKWIVNLQMNSDPQGVATRVRSIQPEGGTNIYAGLEQAYQALANLTMQDAAIKHVILLTDGHSQEPVSGGYIKIVGQMMRAGITLSTIGVGDGHDQQLLNQLARMGGGQYHPVQNPNNLPQVFIKEAKTIRKNLIKETPFEPQVVGTGSPIMSGFGAVPPLQGLVLTGEKDDPRVFMPILGPEGEPVFAHWQVGLGRSAAFTSDATNRWATQWLQWGGYPDFWARTIRNISRPSASRQADLLTTVAGDTLRIRLDAAAMAEPDAPGRTAFGNFKRVRGGVVLPDGSIEAVELEQTGPGRYEASVPATAAGNYIVNLMIEEPDGTRRSVLGGTSRPPGDELRRFRTNYAALQQVAQITGGRLLDPASPDPPGLFERTERFESRSVRPLWRTLLTWLIVLLLLDVACRRIAWDAAAMWAWTKDRAATLLGVVRPGETEGRATLDALKSRRTQTSQRLGRGEEPTPAMAGAGASGTSATTPARTRKFEADPAYEPATDLAEAVGGASTRTTRPTRRADRAASDEDGTTEAAAEDSTTGRLLAAKRRSRERIEDSHEPRR